MTNSLERLRGGLVVSCQPVTGGPMDRPEIVAAMAQSAAAGGASGLRIEGVKNLAATRATVYLPIIGIVKTEHDDTPVRITTTVADAVALIEAGAEIVAYDATDRPRPDSREKILRAILDGGAIAMADCSSLADGQAAMEGGAGIIGTTLSGYTAETETGDAGPDLALLRAFAGLGPFVMAEGRYNAPELAAAAMSAGADCVTVGSAITRVEHTTDWFAAAISGARRGG